MLGQGCLRALFGEQLISTSSVFKWVYINGLTRVQKRLKSGFLRAKVGENGSKHISSVHTRCIVKTSGFTRGVCKNRGFY